MGILFYNLQWMQVNIFLALVPVLFTALILQFRKTKFKYLFYFPWFIFIPNTIYLVTDLQYLPSQLGYSLGFITIMLFMQYAILVILGIVTYFYSFQVLEAEIKKMKKKQRPAIIIIENYLIAFAIIIGKIQRTESWYILTNPARVIYDTLTTLHSPQPVAIFIITGLLINGFYFGVKKYRTSKK